MKSINKKILKMENINTIIEDGLTYLWRDKRDGVEYVRFRSKSKIDLSLDNTEKQVLLLMDSGDRDVHFVLHNSRIVEMIEDDRGFTYEMSGEKIVVLSKWEFGLVKNKHIENAE